MFYIADELEADRFELFSNSISGNHHVRLNPTLVAGGEVNTFLGNARFAPRATLDGSRILYVANQREENLFELFSVPSAGGDSIPLSGKTHQVGPFVISESQHRVLYLANPDRDSHFDLFSTPLAGGPSELLSPPVPDGKGGTIDPSLYFQEFEWNVALGRERVAFRGYFDRPFQEIAHGIFSTTINGDQSTFIAETPLPAARVLQVHDDTVFFDTDGPFSSMPTVFRADLSEAGDVQVHALGAFNNPRILLSPDGDRVVVTDSHGVHSVPAEGGNSVLLVSSRIDGDFRYTDAYSITPDGSLALVLQSVPGGNLSNRQLLSVPIDGGTAVLLNDPYRTGRGILTRSVIDPIQLTPDSREVLYLSREHSQDVFEIFMVPADGGPRVRVNGDMVEGGNVRNFRISPDGSTIVYLADQRQDEVYELFSVPVRLHWSNRNGGLWGEVGNWANASGVPTAVLPGRSTSVFVDNTPEAVRLERNDVNRGLVDVASLFIGTESQGSRANVELNLSRFTAARDIVIGEQGRLAVFTSRTIDVGRSLSNRGVFEVPYASGTIVATESFHNASSGSVLVADSSYLFIIGQMRNEGTLTIAPSGEFGVEGVWEGGGTVGSGTVTVYGTLRPGIGIGQSQFGGGFSLMPDDDFRPSKLEIELAGNAAALQYDVVHVLGAAEIEGGLEVRLAAGPAGIFEPGIGDTFIVFVAEGGIDGRFSQVKVPSPDWTIHYGETAIHLEVLDPTGRGDYNGDGRIDQEDLDVALGNWGRGESAGRPLPSTWVQYLPVGPVDQAELDSVLVNWGRTSPVRPAAIAGAARAVVPEPSTACSLVILTVTGMVLAGRARSSRWKVVPRGVVCGFACFALIAFAKTATAQVQLSPPLARGDAVTQFAISPDGRWVAMEVGHSRTSRNMDTQTNDGLSEVFIRRMGSGDWTSLGVARRLEIGFDVTRFDPGSAYLITRTEHDWMSHLYTDVRLHSLATGESWDVSAGLPPERQYVRLTYPAALGPERGHSRGGRRAHPD